MVGIGRRDQQLKGVKSPTRRSYAQGYPLGVLALMILLFSSLPATANPHLERGIKLVNEFEEKKALKVLKRALAWRKNDDALRAKIFLYQGIAYFELLQKADATAAFRRALESDPRVSLPKAISPKIRELFSSMQKALETVPVDPDPLATSQPASQPTTQPDPNDGNDGKDGKGGGDGAKEKRRSINWPAWISAGLAVACAGAAIGMGLAAKSKDEESRNIDLPLVNAQALHDKAVGLANGTNAMIGIGGAAAAAAIVFFVLDWTSPDGTHAAVGPTPGGAMLRLQGTF
jgi:tetratricopeptide (TPR) repeat protein